jgi:hypothetical protein
MSNDGRVGAPRRSDQERRKHLRKKCFLPARLVTAAGSFDCDVLDISQGGAKVEVGIEVADEQAVTLIIKSIGTYAGLVAWRGDGCFGMRFLAQHGTTKVSPAALAAVVGPGKRALDLGPEACRHASPHEGMHVARFSPLPAESTFTLRRGDLICLLRRKSGGRGSRGKGSPVGHRTVTSEVLALADYGLVEIDSWHFMELIKPSHEFFITLMRVTSCKAHRSRESDIASQAARLTDAERALLLRQDP